MTEVIRSHEIPSASSGLLKDDIEVFRLASEQFSALHPIHYESLPPAGAEVWTNFDPDPMEIAHLDVLALIERGYPIFCTDTAFTASRDGEIIKRVEEESDETFPLPETPQVDEDYVAAYVSSVHVSAFQELGELVGEHPKSLLAAAASMGTVSIKDTLEDMTAEHPLESDLWRRAFLTSCLRREYEREVPSLKSEEEVAYEQLRQEGVQPFSPEELIALVHAALQSVIEENPELAPENFQPL